VTAVCGWTPIQTEAPAPPAPEQDPYAMSRRLDGGSNVTAVCGWTPIQMEAPEQDGMS